MKNKKIDYYGEKDNYIHLKFGDARKMYFFTKKFIKKYPLFAEEYEKYWNRDKTCIFENPFQLVYYVFSNDIPVHFYYNFTDTPAKGFLDVMRYLLWENFNIKLTTTINK